MIQGIRFTNPFLGLPYDSRHMPHRLSKILRWIALFSAAALLSLATQVGGVVLLSAALSNGWLARRVEGRWRRRAAKLGYFTMLYLVTTLLIVPLLAPPFGRVPLPIWEAHNVQPLRLFTCLLNRHYVRTELRDVAYAVGDQMAHRYPGTTLQYLDAGFPFLDGFPLLPHLSHDDGKKLDLAFAYTDPASGEIKNGSPSWLGYGACEGPLPGEKDQPAVCAAGGHWQYGILERCIPFTRRAAYAFDPARTKAMVELFAAEEAIGKIFIEPHLQTRLGLASPKVRYHGCQAVRHDDHVHVPLR